MGEPSNDIRSPDAEASAARLGYDLPVYLRRARVDDIPGMHAVRLAVRKNVLGDPARIQRDQHRVRLEERRRGAIRARRQVRPGQRSGKIVRMSDALRAGQWYLCFTCRSCSRPIPFAACQPDSVVPTPARAKAVSVRCPYPGCTARHDYVTSDLMKLQAELPSH